MFVRRYYMLQFPVPFIHYHPLPVNTSAPTSLTSRLRRCSYRYLCNPCCYFSHTPSSYVCFGVAVTGVASADDAAVVHLECVVNPLRPYVKGTDMYQPEHIQQSPEPISGRLPSSAPLPESRYFGISGIWHQSSSFSAPTLAGLQASRYILNRS